MNLQEDNEQGINVLRNPVKNKGLEFTRYERKMFGILGLLPPVVKTVDDQVQLCLHQLKTKNSDLEKFLFLMEVFSLDMHLFYCLAGHHIDIIMPLIYTPTIGEACQNYHLTINRPKGLFISLEDEHCMINILRNWPHKKISVIVVTDGERILGLGDLGANGMGIPVGKLALYTALAGVDPICGLPITLDVGTNNQVLLNDPFYIGLRQSRLRGEDYYLFVDRFIKACTQVFGRHVLIHFENFGNNNAFLLLEKYRNKICCFNDDIQGTAAVVVAAILSATKISKKKLTSNKFLFVGCGEASLGIGMLLVMAMIQQGLSEKEARDQIFMIDSQGLLVENHPTRQVTGYKALFMKPMSHTSDLLHMVKSIKPTALIGAANLPGSFTKEILQSMREFNERPIILALSNPTSNAECTAAEAYEYTQATCLFASGSPFPPYHLDGVDYVCTQANNAYIFPAIGLATVAAQIYPITEDLFLEAAEALADQVTPEDAVCGRILPPLEKIKEVSRVIAIRLAQLAYRKKLTWPPLSLDGIEEVIDKSIYTPYRS